MTNTQLIYTDANKAYRTLITTGELDKQFTTLVSEYYANNPGTFTSSKNNDATKYALLKMFGVAKKTLEINSNIEFAENRIVSRGTTFKVNETGALSITLNRDDTGGKHLGASCVNVLNCIKESDAIALRDFLNAHYPVERGVVITEMIVDESVDYIEPTDSSELAESDFEKSIKATDEYKHANHMMRLDYICPSTLELLEGELLICAELGSFNAWRSQTKSSNAYHGMVQELNASYDAKQKEMVRFSVAALKIARIYKLTEIQKSCLLMICEGIPANHNGSVSVETGKYKSYRNVTLRALSRKGILNIKSKSADVFDCSLASNVDSYFQD